jgi:DNA gyrase subunit A
MEVFDTPVRTLMEQSFLDYAMSVITGRALPDVRDGLKPVHRRVLFAMFEAGNTASKAYRKSARTVGDVIGKYHPHGDQSVYDAAVRMAQPFSLLHPLIDGQGNFGSIDGDNPAAMRYTEMRLTRLSGTMFDDIGKNTVSFTPNYDGSEQEPTVLPVPFPSMLVNGTSGIAVGMATEIPPHNLREVVEVVKILCVDPQAPTSVLLAALAAPDFPTGGIVYGLEGMGEIIETGRGRVRLRAKWHTEERKRGGLTLVVDEIPYAVNKADTVAKIAEQIRENAKLPDLMRSRVLEDVTALRDESSKDGIRIAIDLKAGSAPEAVFAQLARKVNLDVTVPYNCVVLDDGVPRTLGLRQMVLRWVAFRQEVVLKRYLFDRSQAHARLHILKAYMAAIARMDEVIALIRGASSSEMARSGLMELLGLDQTQAQAILDLRLQKLTGMELDSITQEHAQCLARIAELSAVIDSPERIRAVMIEELEQIADKYGKPRQSEIGSGLSNIEREDLVPREEVILVTTRANYIKRVSAASLDAQNRGTRGKRMLDLSDGDEIAAIHQCHSHDLLLVFTESGQVHGVHAWRIPDASPTSKGRHIRNVIDGLEEEIRCMVTVPTEDPSASVVTITELGQVKRTAIEDYTSATRRGGIKGLGIDEGDALLDVFVVRPHAHMMLVSQGGRAIRFDIEDVRVMGRTAGGVRGMRLEEGERLVGAYCIASDGQPLQEIQTQDDAGNFTTKLDTRSMDAGQFLVCIGERGVGKRTSVSEFTTQTRGGKGMIAFKTNRKTGSLVAALGAREDMDLVMFASNGVSNRIHVEDVRETGRSAAGVHLMNLDAGQNLVKVVGAMRQEAVEQDVSSAGPSPQLEQTA